MDNGLEEACPDSDAVFNGVHEWMSEKALRRRNGIIPGGKHDIVERIAREKCFPAREVADAFQTLRDQGAVEVFGEGKGFLVPERIRHVFDANPHTPPPERDTLAGVKPTGCRALKSEASAASEAPPAFDFPESSEARRTGGMEESAHKYGPAPKNPSSRAVQMARELFIDLCEEHGIANIPYPKWSGLARRLRQWEEEEGIDLNLSRQMMEEFVRHPEWCRSSTKLPWEVFVYRKNKLMSLVTNRLRRDPANRRYSSSNGAEYWLSRSAGNRHSQGAEYWLGRR